MPLTTADADLVLTATDGVTELPLMLVLEHDDKGIRQPKRWDEALDASDANTPLQEWLEPVVQEFWFGGVGVDYDVALGLDTFSSPGYILPGGAAFDVDLPASGNSNSPINDIVEFDGDVWVAQQGSTTVAGRVIRIVDGTAAPANSLTLTVGEYVRGMIATHDDDNNAILLVGSTDVNGASGRLHMWDGSGLWTSTAPGAFGGAGRGRMAQVWWETEDGLGGMRLVSVASNRGHISYTKPNSDPMDPASWIDFVATGSTQPGGDLVAARRHIWYNGRDNLFDLDEQGNSPALTSYTPLHQGNGLAVAYLDGYVYRSLGQGLDRVKVDAASVVQENPGLCTPGYLTRSESPWTTGWTTALLPWNGGLLCATYSLQMSRAAIWWGKDRNVVGVETPNPMVWHGPYAINSEQSTVSRMLATDISLSSETRLWAATWTTSQAAPPKLSWISLPTTGGALSNLRTSGAHRYADGAGSGVWQPFARLETLPDTAGDKASMKHINDVAIGSLGLGDPDEDTRIEVSTRADPTPSQTTWGSAQTVDTSPTETFTPDTLSGNKIQHRFDFYSPSGAATPPKPAILDSIRTTYFKISPDVDTWTFEVEYGEGVGALSNSDWGNRGQSVEWYTDRLLELCRGGRTTLRTRDDRRWVVKVKHLLPRASTLHEGQYGRTVRARITMAKLSAA